MHRIKFPIIELNTTSWAKNFIANMIWDGNYSVSIITFEINYVDDECPLFDKNSVLFALHE